MSVLYWNLVLWGHFVWISTHLDNFSINRILNWKKVSFSKPPPTPFRQSPPMQQGSWKPSFQRGKDKQTNVVLKRLPERRQRKTAKQGILLGFTHKPNLLVWIFRSIRNPETSQGHKFPLYTYTLSEIQGHVQNPTKGEWKREHTYQVLLKPWCRGIGPQ